MRKLYFIIFVLMTAVISYAAFVNVHVDTNTRYLVDGLPPTHIRIYYGSQLKTYTNEIVWEFDDLVNTNGSMIYEPFLCTNGIVFNRRIYKLGGLVMGQQFYYAYSYINSNGVESPIIDHSSCIFIVTNSSDLIISPSNVRVIK